MEEHKIYKLIDPNTLEVRYIGYTKKKLQNRLRSHIRNSVRFKNTHKQHWIRGLIKVDKLPIIKLIKVVNKNNWGYWEILYIKKYSKIYQLTNGTMGGDGVKGTKEVIEKIRKKALKRGKFTEEHKKALRGKRPLSSGKFCHRSKGVIAYNNKEELFFHTTREAAEYFISMGLKASSSNIGQCLTGQKYRNGKYKRKKVAGYQFKRPKNNNSGRKK